MVFEVLDSESLDRNDNFRSTSWGPEAAETMCNQVRHIRIRENMVLGDLIDKTPKDVICKVMLEEKIFKTWVYNRTVLIGDGKVDSSFRLLLFPCAYRKWAHLTNEGMLIIARFLHRSHTSSTTSMSQGKKRHIAPQL
jgi:hypothetical protein